ncbi:MAG: sugar phosphate isomerase/epimerase family protein [Christensenellales bacterium]|jgi:inosose dehydratase
MAKIGLSSYSLDSVIESGRMTLGDVIDFTARNGGDCMEMVPFSFTFGDEEKRTIDTAFIADTKRRAKDAGIEIVNYSVLADLCKDGQEYEDEIKRICYHVDIAAELGVPRMRHDVTAFRRPLGMNTLKDFDECLPKIVEGAKRIAQYAKTKGVMTLIENHGFFANGCDRVERILYGVNDDNYGLLLDTGNVICVDEDPSVAAYKLAPMAKMIHLKDFYIRKRDPGDTTQFDCGGRWFRSYAGKYLRGAILAQGDLDIYEMLSEIKRAGYDGNIAVEFEGLEDPEYASAVSLENARRIWEEV